MAQPHLLDRMVISPALPQRQFAASTALPGVKTEMCVCGRRRRAWTRGECHQGWQEAGMPNIRKARMLTPG